ncbi:hypothetical protein Ciccas_010413, partial [Cichlidogyrus casuarinus]
DSQERQTHLPKVTRPQGKYGHNEPAKLRNSFKEPSPPTKSIPPVSRLRSSTHQIPPQPPPPPRPPKPKTSHIPPKAKPPMLKAEEPRQSSRMSSPSVPSRSSFSNRPKINTNEESTKLQNGYTRPTEASTNRVIEKLPVDKRKRMSYHDLPVRRVNTFCLRNPITHEDRIVYRPIKKEIQVSAEDIPHRLAHKITTCTQTKKPPLVRRSASASRQTSVMADSSLSCGYGSMDEGMLMVWFAGD